MKQLYYTSCVTGKSVNGQGGFQIRAVTDGMSQDQQNAALSVARYLLPKGLDEETAPKDAPVRLGFFSLANGQRVLCQSTYVGRDPETKRFGNFFSHMLVDLPNIDARKAISTWKAPFWQCSDEVPTTRLDPLETLQPGNVLRENQVAQYVKEHRELVRFLLRGLFAADSSQRLFVVAPAETIARSVFCLTYALPGAMAAPLTFSTYEVEPITCSARIVGTTWKEDYPRDLDSQCYSGSGFGFNMFANHKRESALPPEPSFVPFALDALSQGRLDDLRKFHDECKAVGADDAAAVEMVYRLLKSNQRLGKADYRQASSSPLLAVAVAKKEGAVKQLVECAVEDNDFRSTAFPAFLKALKTNSRLLFDEIGKYLWSLSLTYLKAGDLNQTRIIWEDRNLLPAVDAGRAQAIATQLLKDGIKPEDLTVEVRLHLLPEILKVVGPNPAQGWLNVPADRLPALLKLEISSKLKVLACAAALASAPIANFPTVSLRAIVAEPEMAKEVLKEILSKSKNDAEVVKLFGRFREEPPKQRWTEFLLSNSFAAPFIDRCLEDMLQKKQADHLELIRSHGPKLLALLPSGQVPASLGAHVAGLPEKRWINDPKLTDFLKSLLKTPSGGLLSEQVRSNLLLKMELNEFLKKPRIDEASLRNVLRVVEGLSKSQQSEYRDLLAERFALELLQRPGSNIKAEFETILLQMGRLYPNNWSDLYRRLLKTCQSEKRFWKNTQVLHAFVSVGLCEYGRSDLRPTPDINDLHRDARDLIVLMRDVKCSHSVIEAIGVLVEGWRTPNAREWWSSLTATAQTVSPGLRNVERIRIILTWGTVWLVTTAIFVALWEPFIKKFLQRILP